MHRLAQCSVVRAAAACKNTYTLRVVARCSSADLVHTVVEFAHWRSIQGLAHCDFVAALLCRC